MGKDLDYYLDKAKELHGDICAGIVMGTRIRWPHERTGYGP
jgi:formylmethanofuran dehydrogenase subunit E